MADNEWIKHVKDEKVSKSFKLDIETLGKVNLFIDEYDSDNFSQAVSDLVNIGLTSIGYRTKEELNEKYMDVDIEGIEIKKREHAAEIDLFSTSVGDSQHGRMRSVINIIRELSPKYDECVPKEVIIEMGESEGMETKDVENVIYSLKRNGQIYEPIHGRYHLTSD